MQLLNTDYMFRMYFGLTGTHSHSDTVALAVDITLGYSPYGCLFKHIAFVF
jgi:hypothetical protein